MRFAAVSALFFAAISVAAPVEDLVKRQSATTCGSTYYSSSEVSAAYNQGYDYYANGEEAGSSDYP